MQVPIDNELMHKNSRKKEDGVYQLIEHCCRGSESNCYIGNTNKDCEGLGPGCGEYALKKIEESSCSFISYKDLFAIMDSVPD